MVDLIRTGPRTFLGRNGRGDEVPIGPDDVPGHFRPGELLKLALAGCAGMSADAVLSRRLGEGFGMRIEIAGDADREQNRYPEISERIELDLSGLDEAAREQLLLALDRAIAATCTVQRTVEAGARVRHEVADPETADPGARR
ncbi:MAG: OsmC family protein [Pseudoclavibacter sp.]|nr:OsmC family protein [Pseudoclavibacter sp.]